MRIQRNHQESTTQTDVSVFARRALAVLTKDIDGTQPVVISTFIDRLYEATQSPDRNATMQVIDLMRRAGIEDSDIAGTYIPATAARLGEAWCSDEMSFAMVSVSSSRLQGMLRQLGPRWTGSDLLCPNSAASCLVVVPKGEQHTLGASVLAGQMRYHGLNVRLELDVSEQKANDLVRRIGFDVVMVSATPRVGLETLRTLVRSIKAARTAVPIIVGGTIIHSDEFVSEVVQANFTTNDWREALRLCDLEIQAKVQATVLQRT